MFQARGAATEDAAPVQSLPLLPWLVDDVALVILTADAIQARYRQSLPAAEFASHSPSTSPAVVRRPGPGLTTDAHRQMEEQGDTHDADQRRRRFTTAASIALRKSIDGPQIGQDGADLTTQSLRSLLAKTAAANVSALWLVINFIASSTLVQVCLDWSVYQQDDYNASGEFSWSLGNWYNIDWRSVGLIL